MFTSLRRGCIARDLDFMFPPEAISPNNSQVQEIASAAVETHVRHYATLRNDGKGCFAADRFAITKTQAMPLAGRRPDGGKH
jgi:hypothetical protein